MNVELRALDPSKRRILVTAGGRWYSSSEEDDWQPFVLREVQGVVALSEPGLILVRREFETFSDLLEVVQKVLARGPASPEMVQHWLAATRCQVDLGESSWTRDFPNVIHLFHDLIDEFFAGRGCSQEVSLRLALEAFDRLHRTGPVSGWSVPLVLLDFADSVYREQYGETSREQGRRGRMSVRRRQSASTHLGKGHEEGRLRRALQAFDRSTLQCLYLWADSGFDETAIAVILRYPADKVRIWLDLVAAKLGRTREGLRDPALLEAVAERLALHPDNKHSAKNGVS